MFRIIVSMLFVAVSIQMSLAQSVSEGSASMSLGSQNGFTVDIDGVDKKITEDVLKKMMKDYGKLKKNKKAKEYYAEEMRIPMVAGSDQLAFYTKLDERGSVTNVTIWADLGGSFVNSDEHPKEAKGMEQLAYDIYVAVKREAIEKEMKDAEKDLEKLEKGLEKLEKKNKGYHKDIENAKKKIEEAEANIEQNLKDQDDQRVMIEKQKEAVEAVISRLNNVGKSKD